MKTFYSHGKLLLTGEYTLLDGALGIALPCKKGQYLTSKPNEKKEVLDWKSLDVDKNIWFEATFQRDDFSIVKTSQHEVSTYLQKILLAAKNLNTQFLEEGGEVTTYLEFERDWGLGSSSTLINNIAHWANVNPFQLLENTYGGSGYDIACASAKNPILYQKKEKIRMDTISFDPLFKDHLFFIHLNKKQDTLQEIGKYAKKKESMRTSLVDKISAISKEMIGCTSQEKFNQHIDLHENLMGKILQRTPIKEEKFADYEGSIKSLGAWGGDFVLASGSISTPAYFKERGYTTVIKYSDMVL